MLLYTDVTLVTSFALGGRYISARVLGSGERREREIRTRACLDSENSCLLALYTYVTLVTSHYALHLQGN